MPVIESLPPSAASLLKPKCNTAGRDTAQKLQAAVNPTSTPLSYNYSQLKSNHLNQNFKEELNRAFISLFTYITQKRTTEAIELIKDIFSDVSSPLSIDDKLEIYTAAIDILNKYKSENKDTSKQIELNALFDRFVKESTQHVLNNLNSEDKEHILTQLTTEDSKHLDGQFKLIKDSISQGKTILFPSDGSENQFGLKTNLGTGIALIHAAEQSRMLQHLALLLAFDQEVSGLQQQYPEKIKFGFITENVDVNNTTVVWGAKPDNCYSPKQGGAGHAEIVKKLVYNHTDIDPTQFLVGINTMGGSVSLPSSTAAHKTPSGLSPVKHVPSRKDYLPPSGPSSDVVPNATSGPSPDKHGPSKNDNLIEDIFKKSKPQDIINAAQDALTKATDSDGDLKNLLQQIIDAHKIELTLQKSDQFKTLDKGKKNEMVIHKYVLYTEQKKSQEQSATPDSHLTVEQFLKSNPPNLISAVESAPSPTGLKNLGNTCFINAALQALKQMEGFVEYINELSEEDLQMNSDSLNKDSKKLLSMLKLFFNNENNLVELIAEINKFELLNKNAQDDSCYVIVKLFNILGYKSAVTEHDENFRNGSLSTQRTATMSHIHIGIDANDNTLQDAADRLTNPSTDSNQPENTQTRSYIFEDSKEFMIELTRGYNSESFIDKNFFEVQKIPGKEITFKIGGTDIEVLGFIAHIGSDHNSGHYVYIKHDGGTNIKVFNDETVHTAILNTDKTSYTWTPDGSTSPEEKTFRPQALVCRKKVSPHTP